MQSRDAGILPVAGAIVVFAVIVCCFLICGAHGADISVDDNNAVTFDTGHLHMVSTPGINAGVLNQINQHFRQLEGEQAPSPEFIYDQVNNTFIKETVLNFPYDSTLTYTIDLQPNERIVPCDGSYRIVDASEYAASSALGMDGGVPAGIHIMTPTAVDNVTQVPVSVWYTYDGGNTIGVKWDQGNLTGSIDIDPSYYLSQYSQWHKASLKFNTTPAFTDDYGHTLTNTGLIMQNTSTPAFTYGRGYATFVGNNYASPPNQWLNFASGQSDFAFGSNDLTIGMWVNFTNAAHGTVQYLYDGRPAGGGTPYVNLYVDASNRLTVTVAAGGSSSIVGGTPTSNVWHYIEVARQSGKWHMFLDATEQGIAWPQTTDANSTLNGLNAPFIGIDHNSALQQFNGLMDEIDVWNGVAIPPNQLYPMVYQPETAIQSLQPMLLLHMNGAQSSTTFTDSSVNAVTMTKSGTAFMNTTVYKLGGASGYFDGTGYLSTPYLPQYALGNGSTSFTISMWANVSQNTSIQSFVSDWAGNNGWAVACDSGGNVYFNMYNTVSSVMYGPPSVVFTRNSWHHIAVVGSGGTITVYVDGIAGTPVYAVGGIPAGAPLYISNFGGSGYQITGHIDELAIWNNESLPISSLYPQSTEFDTDGNPPNPQPFVQNATAGNIPSASVIFTDRSTGSTSWLWEFGDGGVSSLQNPTHTYTTMGNYSVSEYAGNLYGTVGMFGAFNATVGVPYPSFTETPTTGLPGLLVTFTDTSDRGTSSGLAYNWSFGDNAGTQPYSNTVGTTSHVYAYAGIFTPVLKISNGNGTNNFTGPQISIVTNQNQQQTWYTPKQTRYKIVDGNQNPVTGAIVNAYYISSTFNTSFLNTAFGIPQDVVLAMTNSSLAMSGTSGTDGYVTFMQVGSLYYNITISSTNPSVTYYSVKIMPMDNEYIIPITQNFMQNVINNNSATQAQNYTLWVSYPNASFIRIGINATDKDGTTTSVKFNVGDKANGTVYKSVDLGNIGTTLQQAWLDVPNIKGYRYYANYTATRNIP